MAQKTSDVQYVLEPAATRKERRDSPYRKAMAAVMNKLIRIIYALLKIGSHYDGKA